MNDTDAEYIEYARALAEHCSLSLCKGCCFYRPREHSLNVCRISAEFPEEWDLPEETEDE